MICGLSGDLNITCLWFDSGPSRAIITPMDAAVESPEVSNTQTARFSAGKPAATFGLSWRLLVLTSLFVMLAEIFILVPSMASFRVDYLSEKIDAAHLIMSALEAAPGSAPAGQIDAKMRDRLLDQAGMLGLTILRPNMPPRTLGPRMPPQITKLYDLRGAMATELVFDTFNTMMMPEPSVFAVTGLSKVDQRVIIEVVLEEQPLRDELWTYFRNLLVLSIFISVTTAALVYASLQWLAVRPLRKLTANMISFQADPQDPRRIITPLQRSDEVGTAELALADMQQQIRALLFEKERLAGVGFAVTKISHDLKNILTTAQLESDRLENAPNVDPEIKIITSGIVRAIDRAVRLSANTIRFAREGLPETHKQSLSLLSVLNDVRANLQPALQTTSIFIDVSNDVMFSGDSDLLQRALENLIRNAAESSATRVILTVEQTQSDAVLLLADDGKGLPKKALDNLFVPFSGSAKAGGTGLGLPIAREALRVQGGDIVLRSSSASGTVFAVLLPVA